MSSHALAWLRSDLRVRDNAALYHAARDAKSRGGGVIAVFCVCRTIWLGDQSRPAHNISPTDRSHDWGAPKLDFVLRGVQEVGKSLQERGIPLRVISCDTFEAVPDRLVAFAKENNAPSVHFNREYPLNERLRDEAVIDAFGKVGFAAHAHTDAVVFEPGLVQTADGRFYSVFGPFKKNWRTRWTDDAPPTLPMPPKQEMIKSVNASEFPSAWQDELGQDERERLATLWPAGEAEAHRRLKRFLARGAQDYKDRRDTPAEDGTSRLSPYLAAGMLSPRQCVHAASEANDGRIDSGDEGVVGWIDEIIWREFYASVCVGFVRVNKRRAFDQSTEALQWSRAVATFERWQEGRTGIPIVDAGMRQLRADGWMHNRLRMIVASFLTKNLFLDWRWGEKHFARSLVDLDFPSNNGGWQWSASTGTDPQPYFRVFNPVSQSERHDPSGGYIRKYVPELADVDAKAVHDPSKLPDAVYSAGYPEPIVDLKESRAAAIGKFRALKK